MANWVLFCKNKIDKIEKVWNRKLEDDRSDSEEDSATEEDNEISVDSQFTQEEFLDRLLTKGQNRVESRSNVDYNDRSGDADF